MFLFIFILVSIIKLLSGWKSIERCERPKEKETLSADCALLICIYIYIYIHQWWPSAFLRIYLLDDYKDIKQTMSTKAHIVCVYVSMTNTEIIVRWFNRFYTLLLYVVQVNFPFYSRRLRNLSFSCNLCVLKRAFQKIPPNDDQ